jgi:hypothetical protein
MPVNIRDWRLRLVVGLSAAMLGMAGCDLSTPSPSANASSARGEADEQASPADRSGARQFLTELYAHFERDEFPPFDWLPLLAPDTLVLARSAPAVSDGGHIWDFDPLCVCQDSGGLVVRTINIGEGRGDRLAAEVAFDFRNSMRPDANRLITVRFELVRVNGEWRIFDVSYLGPEGPPFTSMRAELQQRRAAAGASATWSPEIVFARGDDLLGGDCMSADNAWSCMQAVMRRSNASSAALQFASRLEAIGNPGWASDFQDFGRVDLVATTYPLRANTNGAWLMVNGAPDIVEAESFELSAGDQRLATWQRLMRRHPSAFLTGRAAFLRHERTEAGGQRFVFADVVADCRACEPLATAEFVFEFAPDGRFTGTRLVRVGPPSS